jgi:hypothetical protein
MSAHKIATHSLPALEAAAAQCGRAEEFQAAASPQEIARISASVLDQLVQPSSPIEIPSTPPRATSQSRNPNRHKRLCAVCRHPQREAIEEAFLQWSNLYWVARKFSLPDRASIYRHAHAMDLFPRRKANLRFALEHIIEESERVKPTVSGIVEAVRAYAHIDDSGSWIEPPTTHFVVPATPAPGPRRRASNRNTPGDRK